ncbi:MAG: class I SAM-dependent DNA methyltransferase [Prevotella sp.]|nr:class I SAM-dependent DNA methyltransferase [Prevotella sp.]
MAKKSKTFSHIEATDALERLGQRGTSAQEFVYDLLRIFAHWGDGQVRRAKEGPGNASKDGRTLVVKDLIAYRPMDADSDISAFYDEIKAMRDDPKIAKHLPRLYVVSDGKRVVAVDPKINDEYNNTVDALWRDFEFLTPLAGIEKVQHAAEAEADVKSAELMAKLFDDIRRYNDIRNPDTVHALNVFMSRLLFCFFAEDTGLFPGENLFTDTLRNHTKEDGSDLSEFIDRAFLIMSTNDEAARAVLPKLYSVFPYVNGGLFREHFPIPRLSRRARRLILNCGDYNWREINPDIFGSMIQAVVTPEQRAGLGMHYTSVPNIEKVIRPLFLDSLNEEFEAACAEAREKMAQKISYELATQRLKSLLDRVSKIKFFDPACGSGNFLIISYKRLRELEIRIWEALRDIAPVAVIPFPTITLTQFYGIELDEYACDTATLSLWLAEHQMNVLFRDAFGVQPETLPLKPSGHIVCGNACRLDWDAVCPHTSSDEVYIMGNPPYLGSSLQDSEQKEDMKIAIGDICKGYKKLDYIAVWFIKAAEYCKQSDASYAFVSTNSISQGEQVALLWPIIFNNGLEIKFAYTSFKWSNNAKSNAAVTVVIIGVGNKSKNTKKKLFSDTIRIVENINPYLNSGADLIVKAAYSPLNGMQEMTYGCKANDDGNLILEQYEIDKLLREYPVAEKFIKPLMGSLEFIRDEHRFCLWIDDVDFSEAYSIPPIRDRIERNRIYRQNGSAEAKRLAERPHQFREHYHISERSKEKILVPRVSSERREYIPIGYVDKDTIISDSAFAVYDAEKWLFALLTSKMHNLWVRAVGGRLKTDIRYSATLCYNTFPFPKLTEAQKKELSILADNIITVREENYFLTLGEMYNPETMPEDLRQAHHQLDLAVERIYRPEPFASDEERLAHLFKLYAKMTKK